MHQGEALRYKSQLADLIGLQLLQFAVFSYYLLSLQLSQHNLGCGVDELAMSTGNHLWLKQCCDRIEELQCLIKANASTGKRSVDIPW